ncbi:MAG: pyruvate kinase [Candidatus Omnitrophica bacterium]|nr:pyruvate kinase [Candidatus Omnitrophota bacterium]
MGKRPVSREHANNGENMARARTKIVATLGPASSDYSSLRKMVLAGMDIARLNFSHGTHSFHLELMGTVRKINRKYKRRVRILQDLEGFRIRIGKFKGQATQKPVKKRMTVWLTNQPDDGDPRVIPFDYTGDLKKIGTGKLVYIEDGNIILKTKGSTRTRVKAEVVEGTAIRQRKGINMPDVSIPFSGITPKDIKDLKFGVKHKVDMVAQSFVRTAGDMETIRREVENNGGRSLVVAKIESREALKNIDGIIDASDGIMVARGDMGIAVPIYKVPAIQKTIIKKCNEKKKFVITATQMLEHMTEHSRPTRAEVTDVANAILDGTDCVMLSEESAAGKYPVESVRMMELIIKFTEQYEKNGKIALSV